jgi:hypothetical protein
MATRKLEHDDWQQYFDRISRHLQASRAQIDVTGIDIGAQVAAERLSIEGLSYDPQDDAVVITATEVEHRIAAPQQIYVIEELGLLRSFEIVDAIGHKQIVVLTPVDALPSQLS